MIARELTKRHQQFLRGTAETLARSTTDTRGEVTVVVGVAGDSHRHAVVEHSALLEDAVQQFIQLTNCDGVSRREALRATAKRFGLASRVVYSAVEKAKSLGK
jgi:16S rRNA (cytidine1402-2'-O)-methyltransferase